MRKWASIPREIPEIMSLVIRQACDGTHFHTSPHALWLLILTDMNAVTPSGWEASGCKEQGAGVCSAPGAQDQRQAQQGEGQCDQ